MNAFVARSLVVLACLAWAAAAGAECSSIEAGDKALSADDYETALECFRGHIRRNPKDSTGYVRRAALAMMLQEPARALPDLEVALQLKPGDRDARFLRAAARVALGQGPLALPDLDVILAADAADAEALDMRGTVHELAGDCARAVADFDAHLKLRPKAADVLLQRARCHVHLGDSRKALADFDAALRLNPKDAGALRSRGRLHGLLEDYPRAAKDLDAALALEPTDSSALALRSIVHQQLGQTAKAIADARQALKHEPDRLDMLRHLAFMLAASPDAKVRNGKEAVALATRACELTRWQDYQLLYTLAAAYAETGDFKQALATLKRSEERVPPDVTAPVLATLRSTFEAGQPYRESPATDDKTLRVTACWFLGEGDDKRAAGPFAPGDLVQARCQVRGYAVDPQGNMRVRLQMTATDPAGLQLIEPADTIVSQATGTSRPPVTGTFRVNLVTFVPAGRYQLRFRIEDLIAGRSIGHVESFDVRRAAPPVASTRLEVRGFVHSAEEGGPARLPATFQAGDTVHYRFEVAGFGFRGNEADVHISRKLRAPSGKVLIDDPDFGGLKETVAYHPNTIFLPSGGHLRIPQNAESGVFTDEFTVTDRVSGKTVTHTAKFTVRGSASAAAPAATRPAARTDDGPGLHEAAYRGNAERVKALISRGVDVQAPHGDEKLTALQLAAQGGHLEIVTALVAARADVNAASTDGSTALLLAASQGHAEVVRVLLAARAGPGARQAPHGWTALISSASKGHLDTVRALLAAGADANARLANGWTALLLAAQNGHTEVAGALLAARADPEARSDDGWTPLIVASQNGHAPVVRALLKAGAKPNLQQPTQGVTALFMASQNGHAEIVQLLLASRADVKLKAVNGTTPLAIAKQQNHAAIVAMLEKAGARE